MSYVLFFLAILMAFVVWWLVKQTVNLTPWTPSESTEAVRSEGVFSMGTGEPLHSQKLALGVFLAVVTSLFALFISAYSLRMEYSDWRPMPEPTILWINTAILIVGSLFLQHAWSAAKRLDLKGVRLGVAIGGIATVSFMVGQVIAWNQLLSDGYFVYSNPANAFFYLLTALHALHLCGGLIAVRKTLARAWTDEPRWGGIALGTELCAVYWHYLLAIWVILFGFMLST